MSNEDSPDDSPEEGKSDDGKNDLGKIVWHDLTVGDASTVSAFYKDVVGWDVKDHAMEGYDDYVMVARGSGEGVAGVCHARGANDKVPPQWLIYVTVADVEASAARCVELGGEVVDGPRPIGTKPFCVVRDPAGAVLALIEG
jgi:predicted enzyme related to lactoylglutathione lyase